MAATLKLVISPAAQQDLRDIHQFSLRTWGQAQSSEYLAQIKEQFWTLSTQPHIGVERPELAQGLRSIPVKNHILFYRVQNQQLEIVRVLHGRQDPNWHIR
jgi:toxin ParE1/3/4